MKEALFHWWNHYGIIPVAKRTGWEEAVIYREFILWLLILAMKITFMLASVAPEFLKQLTEVRPGKYGTKDCAQIFFLIHMHKSDMIHTFWLPLQPILMCSGNRTIVEFFVPSM